MFGSKTEAGLADSAILIARMKSDGSQGPDYPQGDEAPIRRPGSLFPWPVSQDPYAHPLIGELLELAGALDVAEAAWLGRLGPTGSLEQVLTTAGAVSRAEILDVVNSLRGWAAPGAGTQPLQCISDDREYLVCPIAGLPSERIVLFFRARPLTGPARQCVRRTATRIQRLVQLAMTLQVDVSPPPQALGEGDAIAALDLVDLCPFGMMILDTDQSIMLANKAMAEFFARSSLMGNFNDRLEIFNSDDAVRFQVALRSVLRASPDAPAEQTVALSDGGARPLLLSVVGLAGENGQPRACVIVTDTAADYKVHIQPLAQVFALTPAEARLVTHLVHGRSLQDAAQRLKLKIETARTYLKQIFQKTGTRRQIELVALMKGGALPSLA